MMNKLLILVVAGILSGCTWVKVSEAGASVRVLEAAESACTSVGKITAISRAKVAGVQRKEEKLATELVSIARNQAPSLGGNAVLAAGAITGNEQAFQVFNCR